MPQVDATLAAPPVRALYRGLVLIRLVEERLCVEYASRRIRGPIHLSVGQEAVAVGVLHAARPDDVCLSTHRNHAHYLAKGGRVSGLIDELYGLDTGCCKGWGGSMHMMDVSANLLLSSAIVAGSVPIAAGVAFALQRQGAGRVAIVFAGDGGMDEGVFFETLNLSALLRVPVLFVIENNGISTLTPLSRRQARADLSAKAEAFGVETTQVDGDDVIDVWTRTSELLAEMRRTGRPQLLEASTQRRCAHVGPVIDADLGDGDPLARARRRLAEEWPEAAAECAAIERSVADELDAVVRDAAARFDAEAVRQHLPAAPPPPDPRRV